MSLLVENILRDGRQSETALIVRRGVCRHLAAQGLYGLCEIPLPNGRRADIMAICPKGTITIIEIKSSMADWRADSKWPDYNDYCDELYFACPPHMDHRVFPEQAGLMVADGYGAEVMRMPPQNKLPPNVRKKVTLLLARAGASRMMTLSDPEGFGHLRGLI